MPALVPDVAIVTYNTDFYLLNLLESLAPLAAAGAIGTVHVWDNGSRDDTPALLETFASSARWLRTWQSHANVHHGPALDALLRGACASDWVLALDVDTEARPSLATALRSLEPGDATFVGQIHPEMPHLYAYLAHVLVHRGRYLELPPFRHHGAPGIDYFRAIEQQGRPYLRFRWQDHVAHFGQGALRRLVDRNDTANEFFAFALDEAKSRPSSRERRAREETMRRRVARLLERPVRAPRSGASTLTPPLELPVTRGAAAPRQRGIQQWRASARLWLSAPRRAMWMRQARRLGLVQIDDEAAALLRIVSRLRPRRVLEIGTAHGGSFLLWARAAAPDATLISVDLPPWELDDPAEPAKQWALRAIAGPTQRVHVIRGDSHAAEVRQHVKDCLSGPIDFLFIDGDHSLDGVRADFADYAPMVRRGGLIALHDIHPHSRGWGGEVPSLWRTITRMHRCTEIVAHRKQDGFGIGLVWT